MNSLISRRQRLLMLLAGFFGLVITATLSVFPGPGVAEVIRAGTAAAANIAGTRVPASRASVPDRDRRTAPPRIRAAAGERTPASAGDTASPSQSCLAHGRTVPAPARDDAGRCAAERSAPPPSPATSSVQVRGPPSTTGS